MRQRRLIHGIALPSSRLAFFAVALGLASTFPPSAYATFPGRNGVIAFVSQRDECLEDGDECNFGEPQIFSVRPDGSDRRRLVSGFGPAFSRHGRWLAFDRCYCSDYLEADSTVFTWGLVAGTSPVPLLGAQGEAVGPNGAETGNLHATWSPSGARLAFARARNPTDRVTARASSVYSISRDGSGLRRLAGGYSPDWSSTNRIAFVRYGRPSLDIYVMRPDGAAIRRVGRGAAPSWSPHGRWIAFEDAGREPDGIYIARPDGSGLRRLTNGNDFEPAWSPDGRLIAFTRASRDRRSFRLMTMPLNGRRARAIAGSRQLQLLDAPSWRALPATARSTPSALEQGGRLEPILQPQHRSFEPVRLAE